MQQTSVQKKNKLKNNKGEFNMFNQLLKKRIGNEKGLTLIELLAVIVILAIVAAIAIPAIGNIIDNSRIKSAKADVVNIISAANLYFTENPDRGSVTNTGLKGFVDSEGILEGATYTVTKGKTTVSDETTTTTQTSLTVSSNSGVVKVGNRNVTIENATIDGIEPESPDSKPGFTFTK